MNIVIRSNTWTILGLHRKTRFSKTQIPFGSEHFNKRHDRKCWITGKSRAKFWLQFVFSCFDKLSFRDNDMHFFFFYIQNRYSQINEHLINIWNLNFFLSVVTVPGNWAYLSFNKIEFAVCTKWAWKLADLDI